MEGLQKLDVILSRELFFVNHHKIIIEFVISCRTLQESISIYMIAFTVPLTMDWLYK